jgi:predicted transcriptional regulator
MKYRSRTEIVAQMLEAAIKPATKTRVMYSAFLSHSQLKEYLEVLHANNLLHYDEKNRVYRTAPKGLNFLELYQQMGDLVIDERNRRKPAVQSP